MPENKKVLEKNNKEHRNLLKEHRKSTSTVPKGQKKIKNLSNKIIKVLVDCEPQNKNEYPLVHNVGLM